MDHVIALGREIGADLRFASPVHTVYRPLVYASQPAEAYWRRFGNSRKEAVFVGMNPGPFGMVQTGVPFGEVDAVRNWMEIDPPIALPKIQHPKRPVLGFDCARSEVSGRRLWSWAKSRFGTADAFFERFFVLNYCPLAFLEESGRNRTPDKLPVEERQGLFAACDHALRAAVNMLDPDHLIGIGKFAKERVEAAIPEHPHHGMILHPSPANPHANRGWSDAAEKQLAAMGIDIPLR